MLLAHIALEMRLILGKIDVGLAKSCSSIQYINCCRAVHFLLIGRHIGRFVGPLNRIIGITINRIIAQASMTLHAFHALAPKEGVALRILLFLFLFIVDGGDHISEILAFQGELLELCAESTLSALMDGLQILLAVLQVLLQVLGLSSDEVDGWGLGDSLSTILCR